MIILKLDSFSYHSKVFAFFFAYLPPENEETEMDGDGGYG